MHISKRTISMTFVMIMTLLITGCGYHLRGAANFADQPIKLVVPKREATLKRLLRTRYLNGGALLVQHDPAIADDVNQAASLMTVNVMKITTTRRELSVDEFGRPNEFELTLGLHYALDFPDQKATKKEVLYAYRAFTFDRDLLLGKQDEQTVLYQEALVELADRLVMQTNRRLQARMSTLLEQKNNAN